MFKENERGYLFSKKLHILPGARLFYLFLLFTHSFISRFHLVTGGDGGLFITLVTTSGTEISLFSIN